MRTFARKREGSDQARSDKSAAPGRAHFGRVNSFIHLQRTVGNQAVLRLVGANAEDLGAGSTASETARPGHHFSRTAAYPEALPAIQTKLTVSTAGDVYEQEADRVADEVMRAPDDAVSPGGAVPGATQDRPGQRIRADSGEGARNIRRKATAGEAPAVTPAVAAGLAATKGRGEPLPESARSSMEPRFGVDLSWVRVHRESTAAALNRELRSQAFTHQRDIYFGAGKYQPGSAEGKRLLAHELTHAVQQSETRPPDPRLERGNARETVEPTSRRTGSAVLSSVVQRQPDPNASGDEADVVESVIEAMQQPNRIAGASDVDRAFEILNKYSISFLLPRLAKVYDRGYFHGLLGYLAPGTKADNKVIVAIRFTQCQKEPGSLAYEEIIEAESYLRRIYSANLPSELMPGFQCLEQQRIAHQIRRERRRAASRQGPKTLTRGTMDWWLVPLPTYDYDDYQGQPSARIQILFTPNEANRKNTITFLQTVLQTAASSRSTERVPLLDIGRSTPFEPFYGADLPPGKKEWVPEGAPEGYKNAPSSAADPTASLYDEPSVSPPSEDKPEYRAKMFEAVAVVPATGEVLGALRWGVSWAPDWGRVLGAESKDCSEAPSADFGVALDRFYATPKTVDAGRSRAIGEEHYAAILDGFSVDDASLTQAHKKQLDAIVEQFRKFTNLSAIVGGFADESEKDPFGVSQRRADNVKAYLIDRGVPRYLIEDDVQKSRIETAGFGALWARFPASAKENRNRRVQILLRF